MEFSFGAIAPCWRRAALAVACWGLLGNAAADTVAARFAAAEERAPSLQVAGVRRDAAALRQQAASRWTAEPPAISLSQRGDRLNRNAGQREQELGVSVPLWLPGERGRTQAAAAAGTAQLDATLVAERLRIAGEVREAFWACQRAAGDAALAADRTAAARALAADVSRRVRAGDLAPVDAFQADAAVAAARVAEAEAAAAVGNAATRLQALTGAGCEAPADTPEPRPQAEPAPGDHPAVREAEAKAEQARAAQALIAAQQRGNPELSVGAVRERDARGERYAQSLLVGLRIPLGSGDAGRARLADAGADALEAELAAGRERARVAAATDAARSQAAQAEAVLAAAADRARASSAVRDALARAFTAGESDWPTRQRAEADYAEAQRLAQRARTDAAAALSQWRQALGLLPQ